MVRPDVTVSETGGVLQVAYTSLAAGTGAFGGYDSLIGVDTSRACLTARLASPVQAGGYAYLTWETLGTNDKVELEITESSIRWWYQAGLATEALPSVPTTSANTPFVRMQRANGETTLEVSDDGVAFVVLGRTSLAVFDVTSTSVRIGGTGIEAVDGAIEWDEVELRVP